MTKSCVWFLLFLFSTTFSDLFLVLVLQSANIKIFSVPICRVLNSVYSKSSLKLVKCNNKLIYRFVFVNPLFVLPMGILDLHSAQVSLMSRPSLKGPGLQYTLYCTVYQMYIVFIIKCNVRCILYHSKMINCL